MINQHPITPPLKLVHQWADMLSSRSDHAVFSLAAQWGSDQELETCLLCLRNSGYEKIAQCLHDDRRPKPPSLKEQALTALHAIATGANDTREQHQDFDTIRKALEALPND
jgi:hypothetical protein